MNRTRLLCASVLTALCAAGCTTRGIPHHGGGKRFAEEQYILANATRKATEGINWEVVKDKNVVLTVYSIGDEGGGAGGSGGLGLTGLLSSGFGGGSSAGDMEYVKGVLAQKIMDAGGTIATTGKDDINGEVIVVVGRVGTNRHTDSNVIFWTDRLDAEVKMSAHYRALDNAGGGFRPAQPLKGGESCWFYSGLYFLGIGPVNGVCAARVCPTPGPACAAPQGCPR
ncbi:MAG: hypothetical protein HY812_16500 [Planctomycetes bacterium]|nr:hypothetical protein [Planctomycetota bacterium]